MTDEGARFETGVANSWGFWPERPTYWSYSSLREVEACPRRWMLVHAAYPDIWTRRGYPLRPSTPALLGDVVHSAIDVIVEALTRARCTSIHAAEAVGVIRELGGLSAVLRDAIESSVTALTDNPRLNAEALDGLRQALTDLLGVASNRVQVFLSRGNLPAWSGESRATADEGWTSPQTPGRRSRAPVGSGAHPEVDVIAEHLRLRGRIDLLTVDQQAVTITEYKTGQENPSHDEQVRLYALLWDLDRQTNPNRRPATSLVLSYPGRERAVDALSDQALRALEEATTKRIEHADAETAADEPRALPGPDTCTHCQVRQLCQDYWERQVPDPAAVPTNEWFDLEGTVVRRNGIKSWRVEATMGSGAQLLVRTASPSDRLPVGQRVRLLGLRKVEDADEPNQLIGALGSTSETFLLDKSSA